MKLFLPFGSPAIEEDEIQEVVSTLRSGWLTTGSKVYKFQDAFAKYKNVSGAAALSSCFAALHLAFLATKIEQGDEVITTPMTFCATINAIIHTKAIPVLADIDPKTMNIDPQEAERKITSRTKTILPVHFGGRPCDLEKLTKICQKNGLNMIEDCAHAIEAEYHGVKTGTSGDFGCFSFYANKNITTGEGGMLIAKDEEFLEKVKCLSMHGISRNAWKRFGGVNFEQYDVKEPGLKYNMTDIQASIGIHQLKKIETYWKRRQEIWETYEQEFAEMPIQTPSPPEKNTKHAYHLYTILIDEEITKIKRNLFIKKMNEKKVGVSVHYLSIPEYTYYQQKFQWRPEDYPNAYKISQQTVSLPLHPKLNDDDVAFIVKAVKEVLL